MDAPASLRRWHCAVLAVALLLRIAAAFTMDHWLASQDPPRSFLIAGDSEGYWDLAGDLASGRDYAVYEPPRRVLRMPGFPACLAIPRWIWGDRLLPARLWLAVIGTLTCWGVWRLAREITDESTALLAEAMAACSPLFVAFTPVILSETTFALMLLLSLIAAARLAREHLPPRPLLPRSAEAAGSSEVCGATGTSADFRSVRLEASAKGTAEGSMLWSLLTGGAIALACYVRPSWLLAAPLFTVLLVLKAPHRLRAVRDGLILHAALLLMLLPWGLRNQRATGTFTLTTFWMGPSLYDGLNPQATGDSDMTFFDRDNLLGRGYSEAAMNRHYRDAAWEFVRTNPLRAMQLVVLKLWRYWKPWPNAEQFRRSGAILAALISFLPLLLLAVYGLWVTRDSLWTFVLCAGPILYFAAVHAVFVSSLRYRLPAEYPLVVVAAIGLRTGLARWARRDSPPRTGLGVGPSSSVGGR